MRIESCDECGTGLVPVAFGTDPEDPDLVCPKCDLPSGSTPCLVCGRWGSHRGRELWMCSDCRSSQPKE